MNESLDADLVLEGGGVKGIALVGAIAVLSEHGYRFHKVAGTSAGSIVGALIASGTTVERLKEMMADLDYRKFQDPPLLGRLLLAGKVAQVLASKGWCRGDYLRSWLGERLSERGVQTWADLKLEDPQADAALREEPGRGYRFVAMASDVTNGVLARLPWDYVTRYDVDPDHADVVEAVRASMAIPYFFVPSQCPDRRTGRKSWMVDGGMLSNFPVDTFDRRDGREPRWPTFGIKLSGRPDTTQINAVEGVVSLSKAMLSTMTGFYDRMHIDDPQVIERTIFVDTLGVKGTQFDLDATTANRLYESGRSAAERFLNGDGSQPPWDFESYKKRWPTGSQLGA